MKREDFFMDYSAETMKCRVIEAINSLHYKKLSNEVIAKHIGVKESTIRYWLGGGGVPKALELKKLADLLCCDVNYFYDASMPNRPLKAQDLPDIPERITWDTLLADKDNLGEMNVRIFELARGKGFNPYEFAYKTGNHIDSLKTLSKDNYPISHELNRICTLLDTNQLYIITGEDPDDYVVPRIERIVALLNLEGQKKLLERAEELKEIPKYSTLLAPKSPISPSGN